jgi:anti-sigma B factor antagonist
MDIPGIQEVSLRFTVLTATRRKPVIIDLSEVDMITSIGVGLLISSANALKAYHASMVLLKPQDKVEKVLRLSNIDQVIPIEHELDAALKRIRNPSAHPLY